MNKKRIASLIVATTFVHGSIAKAEPQQDIKNETLNKKNETQIVKNGKKAIVNVSSYLNVRKSACIQDSVIGYVYSKEEITVNRIDGEWANITYNVDSSISKTGFVAVKYLDLQESTDRLSQNSSQVAPTINKAKGIINSPSKVYVSKSLSEKNSYIGYVYPKEEVTVNFLEGDWVNITYNVDSGGTKTGYIEKKLLGFELTNINSTATVLENSLRVYENKSENSKLKGYVFKNEEVSVNFTEKEWTNITYKVDTGGTKTGYVRTSNLKIYNNNNGNSNNNLVKRGKIINVSSSLRVRSGASTNTSVIGYLYSDAVFDIISKESSWYKISFDTYSTKRIGYVHGDYVKEFYEKQENNILGTRISEYAKRFLGVPYVWGGATPKGFDCSGLVQYAYDEFKVTIGRTTWDQISQGNRIERSNLKPGDLIFFGSKETPNNPTHVGMYIGNNEFIHAPRPGDIVKISNLSSFNMNYIQANRYF